MDTTRAKARLYPRNKNGKPRRTGGVFRVSTQGGPPKRAFLVSFPYGWDYTVPIAEVFQQ
ncbi:protein of unknown function [Magnetospira sp. QH-2]|nr:protein of unknown function [Magnetospira sp. QH-2]